MPVNFSELKGLFASIKAAQRARAKAAQKGMQNLGDAIVEGIKGRIERGEVMPPKLVDDGNPTLVRSGTYAESFKAKATPTSVTILNEGQNARISNQALRGILEAKRPHVEPEVDRVLAANGVEIVSAEIEDLLEKL